VFIAALSIVAKKYKQSQRPSTDEWIKKMCAYTMEYYSHKNNKMLSFATA
jgi:hypothetical protein